MAEAETTLPAPPPLELIYSDGEPMDSHWHRLQMNLLIEVLEQGLVASGRGDCFVGGNMFIYYSAEQAHAVATRPIGETRHFRGPDVLVVLGTEPRERNAWVVWQEEGRYPDLIAELLSPSTAHVDRTTKKRIYERTFRTPDYVMYDRERDALEVFHLHDGEYRALEPDGRGWIRLPAVGLWLGRWQGEWGRVETGWIRVYDESGRLVPTRAEAARAEERERTEAERERAEAERERAEAERERAEAERERADAEHRRAEAAEAELARLRRDADGTARE